MTFGDCWPSIPCLVCPTGQRDCESKGGGGSFVMCWSHVRWVLFQRRASHRLLLLNAPRDNESQSHGCGRLQGQDGSQSKHAGLGQSSEQVGLQPYPERCRGPRRASWGSTAGLSLTHGTAVPRLSQGAPVWLGVIPGRVQHTGLILLGPQVYHGMGTRCRGGQRGRHEVIACSRAQWSKPGLDWT